MLILVVSLRGAEKGGSVLKPVRAKEQTASWLICEFFPI